MYMRDAQFRAMEVRRNGESDQEQGNINVLGLIFTVQEPRYGHLSVKEQSHLAFG
jgi:hypothetical protein